MEGSLEQVVVGTVEGSLELVRAWAARHFSLAGLTCSFDQNSVQAHKSLPGRGLGDIEAVEVVEVDRTAGVVAFEQIGVAFHLHIQGCLFGAETNYWRPTVVVDKPFRGPTRSTVECKQ